MGESGDGRGTGGEPNPVVGQEGILEPLSLYLCFCPLAPFLTVGGGEKGDVITSAVHEVKHGLVRSFDKRIYEEWRDQLVCSTLDQPPTRMTSGK